MRLLPHSVLALVVSVAVACPSGADLVCDDDESIVDGECVEDIDPDEFRALPIDGGTDAPIVTNISIECVTNNAAAQITVTDPQGVADLAGIEQSLRLYPDRDGEGQPEQQNFVVQDDGSVEFGNLSYGSFYFADWDGVEQEMCGRAWWPAEVVVTDASGHFTQGRVRAPIVQ